MTLYTARSPWWDNEVVDTISLNTHEQIPILVQQSRQAYTSRSILTVSERLAYVQEFLTRYIKKKQFFAELISQEIGKPLNQSLGDIDYDISYIQYYLEQAIAILAPETVYEDTHTIHIGHFDAKGVWVSISPRNFPTSQFIWQVIPALIAWNTILFKPAHPCIITGKYIAELLASCLPSDVLIPVLWWWDIGEALIQADIDFVVFTGSTNTGKKVANTASLGLKKTFLELGWSAPGIVLPDAAIDDAMMQTISRFRRRHGGQICDGLKRLFVHRSRVDELVATMSAYLSSKTIGNPLDPSTDLGCLVNQAQYDLIQTQLSDAREQWATLIELGNYDGTPWPFMKHTLVLDPTLDMRIMTEEVFWPVLPIMVYDELEEAITRANSTPYGLGGYLRWSDQKTLASIAQRMKTGNINVNNCNYVIPQVPFWGYKKASGNCREHGWMWLREYCELKIISMPK